MAKNKHNIIVICGPTASGKTSLALQMAKELPKANILSVDSRQAYSSLDIITGKDIPEDLSPKIKVFGHNIFNPEDTANLAEFVHYSNKVIQESISSQTPLIIVGGTGLYLKAITQNLSDAAIPPNPILRKRLEMLSLEELQNTLKEVNHEKYSSLNRSDSMNPRRLIRYIEISKSDNRSPHIDRHQDIHFWWIGLSVEKEKLKEQIRARVIDRISSGAINEVKNLINKYPNKKLPIFTSLGVSHIVDYLENNLSIDQLIDKWTNAENDYARRQNVWFKKQPDIVWYDKSTDKRYLVSQMKKIYQQNA